MANSRRFNELKSRLSDLKLHMLPKSFSSTGIYSLRKMDRVRGYRLLVHGEIESFLEDIAIEKLREKVRDWKRHKKPSLLIIGFVCCYHSNWAYNVEDVWNEAPRRSVKIKEKVEEIVDEAVSQYTNIVKSNHGIKTDNLKKLFLPLGIEFSNLDSIWLANMDSFGEQRGLVAHNSIRAHQTIDPQTEYQAVQQLIVGLKKLDELVSGIQ